jgi:translation initiation factor 1
MMDNTRVVYSSDGEGRGRCARCGRPPAACRCDRRPAPARPARAGGAPPLPADGIVRVWRDRRRRRGKTVTVVAGIGGDAARLQEVVGLLKRHCGAGGTLQDDGTIEVQGDHRERVAAKLETLGYRVKLAGG